MERSDLAPQQLQAFNSIVEWYEGPDQLFYLAGWAGTGKTSIAMVLADELVGLQDCIFAAYTGKAAFVMKQRGCPSASTMHSYIYHSHDGDREKLTEYQADLAALTAELTAELRTDGYDDDGIVEALENHPGLSIIQGKIFLEEKALRKPRFMLNPDSVVGQKPLSILDECSMVGEKMALDWLSFGEKVLVLGDPAQLPPVGGEGFFTKRKPNFMLTDIHRQAEGNPVIKVASMVRRQERPEPGRYGSSLIVRKDSVNPDFLRNLVMESDQVIVGKNDTRHAMNKRIRELKGFKDPLPEVGETIVCLRNNHDLGLLNGALYTVVKVVEAFPEIERIDLIIVPTTGGNELEVHCHTQHFQGKEEQLKKQWYSMREAEEFDFGYALTCHKVQGSQFKNPIIFDQSGIFKADRFKWLYTAITRATDSFTLIV